MGQSNTNIFVKFRKIKSDGTCLADCIFHNENLNIKGFILHLSKTDITIDLPSDISEWPVKSMSWESFKVFICERMRTYIRKMKIDIDAILNSASPDCDEIWTHKCDTEIAADNLRVTPTPFEWRNLIGEHNSVSGVSPLVFVPNTVLRLEKYIESHELKGSKNKKKSISSANVPLDALISALSKDDFLGPFELDILTWISRLRYVTSSMLKDLYVSGYIAPTFRKIHGDKFTKILNRMQKYNLVNVTRFASFDDNVQFIESKAVSRIYTLGKSGNLLLKQLGRESTYSAFDIYQDGNIVKGYMAANQHLIRWLCAFPSYIKNNFELTQVIHAFGAEKTGARLYGIVKCGSGTVIIEPARRSDRWTYEENSAFLKDKLSRIIHIISNAGNLYHRSVFYGSGTQFRLDKNSVICYTCEDEAHMHEIWQIIKPVALENPQQRIWFTHDLNLYNDSAEGKRYVEFKNDDTYDIVNVQELFGLGAERDYSFLDY